MGTVSANDGELIYSTLQAIVGLLLLIYGLYIWLGPRNEKFVDAIRNSRMNKRIFGEKLMGSFDQPFFGKVISVIAALWLMTRIITIALLR